MSKSATSPVWPFLSVLACLFVLSVTAPRAWERLTHKGELAKRLEEIKRIRQAERFAQTEKSRRENLAAKSRRDALANQQFAPVGPICQSPVDLPPVWDRRRAERDTPNELSWSLEQIRSLEPSLCRGLVVADDGQFHPRPATLPPVTPHPLEAAPAFGNLAVPSAPSDERLATPALSAPTPAEVVADAQLLQPEALVPPPAADVEIIERRMADTRLMPVALLRQLAALEQDEYAREWAIATQRRLQSLAGAAVGVDKRLFDELAASARTVQELAEFAPDAVIETRLLRAKFALERRLPIWRAVFDAAVATAEPIDERKVAHELAAPGPKFAPRLRLRTDRLTGMRNRLRSAEETNWSPNPAISSAADSRATGLRQLLAEVEAYEQNGLPSDATAIATRRLTLAHANSSVQQQLVADLEEHYENANVRFAVSGRLINRLLPHPETMRLPVAETLAGVPVRGQATTWTQLYARLIPDPQRIRIGLEANGTVASDTVSTSGPATFRNAGRSAFLVQKLFLLGPWGLRSWPAISDARTVGGSLISLETDYDGIPLVASLVRSVARSQFDDSQALVTSEADAKLAMRSRMQFDLEMGARLGKVETKFAEQVSQPIGRLGLEITPIAFSTTEERIIARYRLAAPDQLGAHTPRPRAPSDSLLSVQLHESAINNLLARLGLEGRRFTLPDLMTFVSAKMNRAPGKLIDDAPDDLALTFADQNAVRVHLRDGKLELRLSFAAVEHGRNTWRDFTVTTSYGPNSHGLEASLQRESGVFLDGPGLKGRAELVLRGIFSRALSRNRHIELGNETVTHDARLQDLAVTQLVIDDGWLGIAYGPSNVDREARLRRVKTPNSAAPTTTLH